MTRSMAMGSFHGQMVVLTKEGGLMGNSMGKLFTSVAKESPEKEFGKMGTE